jgi:glycosyltransferase involved in cell wall biosynthesis
VNRLVVSALRSDWRFHAELIDLGLARSLDDLRTLSPVKVARLVKIIARHAWLQLRDPPDVVYTSLTPTGPGFVKDLLALLPARMLRRPLVFHFHGRGIAEWIDARAGVERLYRWLLKGGHLIHLSPSLAERELGTVGSDAASVEVIPNGVRPEIPDPDRDHRDEPGQVRLLFLSNLHEFKGLRTLLHAVAELQSAGVAFGLEVIGDEVGNGERFRSLARELGIDSRVAFLGRLDGPSKWAALASAHIFVHPTLNDAFPLVIIEAMLSRCAVVASDVGGIRDLLGTTGVVVPPGRAWELADALTSLIEDRARRRALADAARERATEEFGIERFQSRVRDVIGEAAGGE